MRRNRSIWRTAAFLRVTLMGFGLLFALAACQTPIAFHGHKPEFIWELAPEAAEIPIDNPKTNNEFVLILKRFENHGRIPVGGHFIGEKPRSEAISQSYAPSVDLGRPIFENTYKKLREAGYPVWKDYTPCPEMRCKNPENKKFRVVHGVIKKLELHTFATTELQEGARANILFSIYEQGGKKIREFPAEFRVKISRGMGDVLYALANRIAKRLAAEINNDFDGGIVPGVAIVNEDGEPILDVDGQLIMDSAVGPQPAPPAQPPSTRN